MKKPPELQRVEANRSSFFKGPTIDASKFRWALLFMFMNPAQAINVIWDLIYVKGHYFLSFNLNDNVKDALWSKIVGEMKNRILDGDCGYTRFGYRESGFVPTWNDTNCFGDFAVGHAADYKPPVPWYLECLIQDIINATLAESRCPRSQSDDSGHSTGFYMAIVLGSILLLSALCFIVGAIATGVKRKSYVEIPEATEDKTPGSTNN